jgi:midasin
MRPLSLQGPHPVRQSAFSLHAPSTARNIMRLLRALSLPKPVLLEGSPGVGKTSLVGALAAASGHALVRINLSEQSDMMDLLGADLPAAGGAAGDFAWADGPLLAAVRSGAWVLLDELNLAPQAVLEGLNALLDHRREVYVPELDTVRSRHSLVLHIRLGSARLFLSLGSWAVSDYTPGIR